MKILATPVRAMDLRPGDLFSTADQAYWDGIAAHRSIGERVYIRTEEPCPEDQAGDVVQLIQVQQ